MTKADLIDKISKETGTDKVKVAPIIESFMDNIKDSLGKGEDVYLRGFGTFVVKHRAQKIARNIRANKAMVIPACDVAAFKPSKNFKL